MRQTGRTRRRHKIQESLRPREGERDSSGVAPGGTMNNRKNQRS